MRKLGLAFASLIVIVILALSGGLAIQTGTPQALSTSSTSSVTSSTSGSSTSSTFTSISSSLVLPPLCSSLEAEQIASVHTAIIKPMFTTTAYKEGKVSRIIVVDRQAVNTTIEEPIAFYRFYSTPSNFSVSELNTTLINRWGWDSAFYSVLSSNIFQNCGLSMSVVNDTTLSTQGYGALENYSVVVLPFEEYMTLSEYDALMTFVSNGGTLITIQGDSFYVLINYSPVTETIQLVEGHGWNFTKGTAYTSNINPFAVNNTNWLGSTFCCYAVGGNKGTSMNGSSQISIEMRNNYGQVVWMEYNPHEDAAVTNFTNTEMIGYTSENSGPNIIGPYIHRYGKGQVIGSSICLDDLIASGDQAAEAFLLYAVIS